MPFLYDVCNVKLQLCAKGFSWSRGGGGTHLKKLFQFPLRLMAEKKFSLQNFYLVLCPRGVHFGNQCRDIQTILFSLTNGRF